LKPAICPVCGRFAIEVQGDMVEFANYAPLPQGYLGHPQGLEWFCNDHLSAAKSASAMPSEEAIKFLKQKYGTSNTPPVQSPDPRNENIVSRFFRFLKS